MNPHTGRYRKSQADKFQLIPSPKTELQHNCPKCSILGTYKSTSKKFGRVWMVCPECDNTWVL